MKLSGHRRLNLERLERRIAPTASPIGPEFRVNLVTTGTQDQAVVAVDADGDFVVAWVGPDASGDGVFAQRYNAAGIKLGGEFQVNTFTSASQSTPAIAINATGGFVIVWASGQQDGSLAGVYGQRYAATGLALGSEFHISQATSVNQNQPTVGMDAAGNFVVAWQSPDGSGQGIFARRYDADGVALGNEFRVNTFTTGEQRQASADMDGDGDFVIAWQSEGQDGDGYGVYHKRFTSAGVGGGDIRVNSTTTHDQTLPSVAMDVQGNTTIVWQDLDSTTPSDDADVLLMRYTAFGGPSGTNETMGGSAINDTAPVVSRDGNGNSIVSWTVNNTEIRYRILGPGGLTGELSVNTYTTNAQAVPAVASSYEGDFVIVWSGEGAGDTGGVFGQRFDEPTDTEGPRIAGVEALGSDTAVIEGGQLIVAPTALRVAFSENMSIAGGTNGANSVLNPANWELTRNGTVVPVLSITFGFSATTRRYEATLTPATSPLLAAQYVLTGRTSLRDQAGNELQNFGNGTTNRTFVRSFTVVVPGAVGSESTINQFTTGAQISVQTASDPAGNFVATWVSQSQDGNEAGIYARRFSANGAPLGNEFRVNTFTAGDQIAARVAVAANGDFVIVWQSVFQDGDLFGVYGQRYNAAGVAQGGEFRVNQATVESQEVATVAMDAAGNFVVVWESADGSGDGVFARRYSAAGVALGGEFRVNEVTTGAQFSPGVSVDADGDFVVVWNESSDGSGLAVFARRFDADAAARGDSFRVNLFTTGDQSRPAVAMDAAGNFVVVWESEGQDGSSDGLFARFYNAAGGGPVREVAVNTTTANSQFNPAVAVDADGDVVIAWESELQDGSSSGIYARRFDPAGDAASGEFRVNTLTTNLQTSPAVGVDADGDCAIVWSGIGGDNSGSGVVFQRYGRPAPRIVSTVVNAGQANLAQRSRVTSIQVTFDSIVVFDSPLDVAFALQGSLGDVVGSYVGSATIVDGVTVVALSGFSGVLTQFGSLIDGRYRLTLFNNRVSLNGVALDGNGDGTAGDDFVMTDAQGLFRFYGDMNGDRRVDISDFGFFSLAYLTPANYNAALDFNADGRIDIADFGQFSIRYFTSLP